MVNPSTESILNQMTNLAMDIAMDYVLPASPMSDVCKSDLYEFEREVVAAVNGAAYSGLFDSTVAGSAGIFGGCCGRPPTELCKKNSYMGAAGCDSCDACSARRTSTSDPSSSCRSTNSSTSSAWSSYSSPSSQQSSRQQPAETTMDISWCQFDGCEFDTADNSYLDICDWVFYADRYALTEENRLKVQKAFQMVPPGDVTGYVAEPPKSLQVHQPIRAPKSSTITTTTSTKPSPFVTNNIRHASTIKTEVKSDPDDDYLWTSDNLMQPIILKAESNADILQITELDHSYLQTPSHNSSTTTSPVKHHPNHLVDMLGLVTPPPSRSQSSGEFFQIQYYKKIITPFVIIF